MFHCIEPYLCTSLTTGTNKSLVLYNSWTQSAVDVSNKGFKTQK